jgi:hypothetical protein
VVEQLQWLLSCLRAQYWNYQQSHWQTGGIAAYGDHLLFERLYGSVVPHVDTLAEKMVGTYGPDAVDGLDLGAKFEYWIKRWSDEEDHHSRGLFSEECFQRCCRRTYDVLKEHKVLSLGMDDFLMGIASDHETNEYLLGQVLEDPDIDDDWEALTEEEK